MTTDELMRIRLESGVSVPEIRNSQIQAARRAIRKLGWETKTSGNRGYAHIEPKELLTKILDLKKAIEGVKILKGFVCVINADETAVAEIKSPNKTLVCEVNDSGNFAKNSTGKMTHTATLMGYALLFNGKIIISGKGDMNVIFHCSKRTKITVPRFVTQIREGKSTEAVQDKEKIKFVKVFQNPTGKTTYDIYHDYIVILLKRLHFCFLRGYQK